MSVKPEFSRPYAVERLPEDGVRFSLVASPDERRALARRFELLALERLEAEGELRPGDERGLISVEGRLRAAVSQRCVVTFEPVPAELDVAFERLFTRDAPATADLEVAIDPEVEQPEPLEGSTLDLGELVAEELAMALDPYPHAPGADAALAALAENQPDAEAGAFASLAALRRH